MLAHCSSVIFAMSLKCHMTRLSRSPPLMAAFCFAFPEECCDEDRER
jgi:hypothetical protein